MVEGEVCSFQPHPYYLPASAKTAPRVSSSSRYFCALKPMYFPFLAGARQSEHQHVTRVYVCFRLGGVLDKFCVHCGDHPPTQPMTFFANDLFINMRYPVIADLRSRLRCCHVDMPHGEQRANICIVHYRAGMCAACDWAAGTSSTVAW